MNSVIQKFKKRRIEKHQQKNGVGTGKLKIQFTPEQIAYFEKQVTKVPGMNYNSNVSVQQARQNGIQATKTKQRQQSRRYNIGEMHTMIPDKTHQDPITKETVIDSYKDIGPNGSGAVSGTDPVGEFIISSIALGKPLQLVGRGVKTLNNGLNSQLNWSSVDWFEKAAGRGFKDGTPSAYNWFDIIRLKYHTPEYWNIEANARKNGTWLKLSDGSSWKGDPRSWIQLQSKQGQKLVPERNFGAISWMSNKHNSSYPEYTGNSWLQNTEDFAKWWSGNHPFFDRFVKNKGKYWEITYPKESKILNIDAKGADFQHVPNPFDKNKISFTDKLVLDSKNNGYDITRINNVVEGNGDKVNDVIIHSGIPRKSLLGNNGDFNLLKNNIFR